MLVGSWQDSLQYILIPHCNYWVVDLNIDSENSDSNNQANSENFVENSAATENTDNVEIVAFVDNWSDKNWEANESFLLLVSYDNFYSSNVLLQ